ncbi:hypothetical protein CAL14_05510 [Bordetella genomosp. 9]|uniref:hypothetical protein n=1 Tax=Bordetella genomosp. 9 TaxID=1416803 RepID=UPI000A2974AE|nr:hypothetical protein [Bordetella genomosp. 9]ARP89812.1 hypothetical protein CAL14_05510 [Bordetella genomosp. 9]
MHGGRRWVDAEYETTQQARKQFEDLLKTSDYFHDVLNSVRVGAGEAIGSVLAEIYRDRPAEAIQLLDAIKAKDVERTQLAADGPSARGARELVLRAVADRLQAEMSGTAR